MKCIILFAVLEIFITMTLQEKKSITYSFNNFFPKVILYGDSLTQVCMISDFRNCFTQLPMYNVKGIVHTAIDRAAELFFNYTFCHVVGRR